MQQAARSPPDAGSGPSGGSGAPQRAKQAPDPDVKPGAAKSLPGPDETDLRTLGDWLSANPRLGNVWNAVRTAAAAYGYKSKDDQGQLVKLDDWFRKQKAEYQWRMLVDAKVLVPVERPVQQKVD